MEIEPKKLKPYQELILLIVVAIVVLWLTASSMYRSYDSYLKEDYFMSVLAVASVLVELTALYFLTKAIVKRLVKRSN